MKAFAYCAVVLSTVLVLAWPFVLMMSAFIFDAPIRSTSDEIERFALAIYIISYPVGYLVGIANLIARRIGQPKGRAWWTKWAIFFFLLPMIQLGLPVLALVVASILDR
jgi:hypothetical protein